VWCGEDGSGVPAITASTRASSTGSSQSASTATIATARTTVTKASFDPIEKTAITTRSKASPHATRLNVQKVTFPTSSAAGNESETAWNFTGLARKETPASRPAQKVAGNASAQLANGWLIAFVMRAVPLPADRGGTTW
jgi:hypothetical protein